jgi:hypothetical protein
MSSTDAKHQAKNDEKSDEEREDELDLDVIDDDFDMAGYREQRLEELKRQQVSLLS